MWMSGAWGWACRGGRDAGREFRLAGEGEDGFAAVANRLIFRRERALERLRDGGSVDIGQRRIEGRALSVARDEDRNVFEEQAGRPGLSAPLARLAARRGRRPFDDSRIKVSSASTIPVNVLGWSSESELRNRCSQRKAVV